MGENSESVNKKVHLVAQEIKLAKVLAGNDKKLRNKALKNLKKWLNSRSASVPLTEDDFMYIWKGLFYSIWMSDKPLVQEECAENISNLVHFDKHEASLLFFKCGLKTLLGEWTGIDRLRLEKFLMFIRRLLRQTLIVLKNTEWKKNAIVLFSNYLSETILKTDVNVPLGLTLHFIEIFLEELAKVSSGMLTTNVVTEFLRPFVKYIAVAKDNRQISHIRRFVFRNLMQQSDLGLEYEDKFKAWKKEGFPGGTIDSMQKIKVQGEEEEEVMSEEDAPLDPRAGHVDVELPQIPFNPKEIAKLLNENKFTPGTTTKSRKCLAQLSEEFTSLSKRIYPLGIKKVELFQDTRKTMNLKKSVNRLVKFENKLLNGKARKRKNGEKELIFNNKKIKLDPDTNKKQLKKTKLENIFKKNSGTWYVYKCKCKKLKPSSKGNVEISNKLKQKTNDISIVNNKTNDLLSNHCFATADLNKTIDLLPNDKSDMKTIENNFKIIKGKSRLSLDSNLVPNPFSQKLNSAKKVKINLKQNVSQEIHEHMAQVKRSPAIPFDANKKPIKPLLKSGSIASPVNPFYKIKQQRLSWD